jgi:hypothetical protein
MVLLICLTCYLTCLVLLLKYDANGCAASLDGISFAVHTFLTGSALAF